MSTYTQPQIRILEKTDIILRFSLTNASTAIANGIRRVILAETEVMAINRVEIHENRTMFHDGQLADRLQLIPLISNASAEFHYEDDCACDDGCPKCEVQFTLQMKNLGDDPVDVTDRHLIGTNPKVYPASVVEQDHHNATKSITIVRLAKNQEISLTARASKGTGRMHAKWNPVAVAAYRPESTIKLNQPELSVLSLEDKEAFVKSCPSGVFALNGETKMVEIEDANRCTWCRECFEVAGKILRKNGKDSTKPELALAQIEPSETNFIFAIESTGCLRPEVILDRAIESLCRKLIRLAKSNKQLIASVKKI